ncbi:MAG: ATP-binding cassette domain-containing protein, partial [Azonexus sp.]
MTSEIRARFWVARGNFNLDVDLTLPGRGVTALFGPSGSGKTTCLRAMAGLERAADGLFALGDTVWQDAARGHFVPTHKRALGMVFQEASLFPHLSVRGNMEFGQKRASTAPRRNSQRRASFAVRLAAQELHQYPWGADIRFALSEVAELLGIGHLLERMPAQLSGGERQRVAIARALLAAP